MKILLVDDDPGIIAQVTQLLNTHHYVVDAVPAAAAALQLLEQFDYDLVLLDVMLPQASGIDLCRQVRSLTNANQSVPILLLSARDGVGSRVAGLQAGADDYLSKPYHADELLARIQALLRRGRMPVRTELSWAELRLNLQTAKVNYRDRSLHLTPKEYRLLELFLRHPQQVFSRARLLDWVWPMDECPTEDAVTTQIKGLRQKLKAAGLRHDPIETVYGLGYRLKSPPQETKSDKFSLNPGNVAAPPSGSIHPPKLLQATSSQPIDSVKRKQAKVLDTLARTWHSYLFSVGTAIERLETVLHQLETQTIDTPEVLLRQQKLYQQAITDAHRLAGSLGSFGHAQGSVLARRIEQLLRQSVLPDLSELRESIRALTTAVQDPPAFTASAFAQPTSSADPPESRLLLITTRPDLIQSVQQAVNQRSWQLDVVSDWAIAKRRLRSIAQPQLQASAKRYQAVIQDSRTLSETEAIDALVWLHRHYPNLPVAVLTADADSLQQRVAIARQGTPLMFPNSTPAHQILNALAKLWHPPEMTLLAVDDDPQFLQALKQQFSAETIQLHWLADPAQFWSVLEATQPDLLLLDINMPQFKGTDLCVALRADLRWCHLPIVAISAYEDAETLSQVVAAGFTDFVPKSIGTDRLIPHIERCFQKAQRQRTALAHSFI